MAQFSWLKYTIFILVIRGACLVFGDQKTAHQNSHSTRVVNGEITQISKHPYIVAVHRRSCKDCAYEHYCGGTIYDENTIITAAHCVSDVEPHDLLIVAGSSYRTGFLKDGGMIFPIAKIIAHNDEAIDLAIMSLALKIPLGKTLAMQAVTFAAATPPTGTTAVIAGWGRIENNGDYSEELREASISILNAEQCQTTGNQICAGYAAGGVGACQGDTGGPLMVNGHMIGVTSWGVSCAGIDKPGVYTDVVKQKNWILSHVLGVHIAFL